MRNVGPQLSEDFSRASFKLRPIPDEQRRAFVKSRDGQLPSPRQLRLLGRMSAEAFVYIRSRSRDHQIVFAIAEAFQSVTIEIYRDRFRWSSLLSVLERLSHLESKIGTHFLQTFDKIIGFHEDS